MRQRTKARRVAGLAELDFCRRRVLRPDSGHQHQSAGLGGVARLLAFLGDQGTIVRSHFGLPFTAGLTSIWVKAFTAVSAPLLVWYFSIPKTMGRRMPQ